MRVLWLIASLAVTACGIDEPAAGERSIEAIVERLHAGDRGAIRELDAYLDCDWGQEPTQRRDFAYGAFVTWNEALPGQLHAVLDGKPCASSADAPWAGL